MEQKQPRIRDLVLTLAVIVVVAFWFFIALPDQDWLWFLPIFNEQACEIRLYRGGQEIRLLPNDAGYDEVNAAINKVLRGVKAKLSRGISEESQEDFYHEYSAVEVFYAEPVMIHSPHAFAKCDKLLFPLSGRHVDPPMVFGGAFLLKMYRAGALVFKNREPLERAVDAVWAAHTPEADPPTQTDD